MSGAARVVSRPSSSQWLARLRESVGGGRVSGLEALGGALRERVQPFRDIAFKHGPSPARADEIAERYGVSYYPGRGGRASIGKTRWSTASINPISGRRAANAAPNIEAVATDGLSEPELLTLGRNLAIREALEGLGPDTYYAYIDSSNIPFGKDWARDVYGAAYDHLALEGLPSIFDPRSVSQSAQWRRNFPALTDVLRRSDGFPPLLHLPHPGQLATTPGLSSLDVMEGSPELQLGAYLTNISRQAQDNMVRQKARIGSYARDPEAADSFRVGSAALSAMPEKPEYDEWAGLTARSSAEEFARLASRLQEAGLEQVGPRTLKLMSITDALVGGDDINPELWRGLFCRGGLAQLQR